MLTGMMAWCSGVVSIGGNVLYYYIDEYERENKKTNKGQCTKDN